MKLSVVIPAYNEQDRLPSTLKEAVAWLQENVEGGWEIVVVDDGSRDETCARVKAMMPEIPELRLLEQPHNRGKGAAVKRGMLEAKGEVRLFMDADHSTHVKEVEKVFAAMDAGAEVVIASRQHPESDISVHQSWLREHMGKSFNLIIRTLLGIDIKDTQCGFKAFSARAAESIFPQQMVDGFSFDVELLYLAARAGIGFVEIPVQWINEPNSKVRILLDPMKMFADIVRIRNLHRD